MADPASLVLAIAPLALEALKGFRKLNSKLRIFCHYSQELKRIRTKFETQQDFFQSECEILLRKVTDSQSQVEVFLRARQFDDSCHDILKRLCTYLGSRQTAFRGIFEDIKASLQDLEAELHGFEKFESERQDGESLKDVVRRLRYRLKITINKTNYDEALERLKQSNYDLKSIRKHSQELRGDINHVQDVTNNIKPPPSECMHFGRVRLATLAFHEAMVTHWVCEEREHQRHFLRLFTDAQVQQDIRMKFFLLGEWEPPEVIGPKRLDLASLEVRSTILECPEPLGPGNGEIQTQSCEATVDFRVVKRRRVAWADETPASIKSHNYRPSNSKRHSLLHHKVINSGLRAQNYQCTGIPGCAIATRQFRGAACLGHLDIEMQKSFRHSFYAWSGICNNNVTVAKTFATAEPLTNLFNQPVQKDFDVVDQLLLAKAMVATILKFHSTPWLGIADESRRSQRIRNTVLYNLGVGLLQIDRWTNLDPDAVDIIDNLATQRANMGPKYRDLVQKCLYCDFGVGADLLKPQLQIEILDKVVGELESMVAALRINDDKVEV
ncbi:hypothetical protein F5B22DRAFT_658626 [Xylaria bambusicola]|uniref:uncharacterized protein n=1 Tax=Xylaria bambusicola TaxID=326684 RepID=UPI002008669B|nr:uncharacterized protein F5B22DRAFT_658626 [Xylaria bambusicola]KAI0509180.1 hypothetical protein F5B22DRAFT_658626 [Xylaria bambusicola]